MADLCLDLGAELRDARALGRLRAAGQESVQSAAARCWSLRLLPPEDVLSSVALLGPHAGLWLHGAWLAALSAGCFGSSDVHRCLLLIRGQLLDAAASCVDAADTLSVSAMDLVAHLQTLVAAAMELISVERGTAGNDSNRIIAGELENADVLLSAYVDLLSLLVRCYDQLCRRFSALPSIDQFLSSRIFQAYKKGPVLPICKLIAEDLFPFVSANNITDLQQCISLSLTRNAVHHDLVLKLCYRLMELR
jgi:hypothetical protein